MIALTVLGAARLKLFGTVWGVLLVSLVAAWCVDRFTSTEVLSPGELLAELSAQPRDVLFGLVGVIFAFVGLSAWREQKRAELCMQAAGDIQAFFKRAFDLAMSIEDYSDDCLELHKKILSGESLREVEFDVDWIGKRTGAVAADRQALSALGVEAHSLEVRYFAVLHSKLFAVSRLAAAVAALNELTSIMWAVPIPTSAKDEASLYVAIRDSSDEGWGAFKKAFRSKAFAMIGYSGAVSGEISGRLFIPSVTGIWHAIRKIRLLADIPDGS